MDGLGHNIHELCICFVAVLWGRNEYVYPYYGTSDVASLIGVDALVGEHTFLGHIGSLLVCYWMDWDLVEEKGFFAMGATANS
ncbi:hypothetical protein N7471_002330 [Penicillium samsonianum]|uniref:uncharacterized protein n=1 Tax=Penicillium samsonianum TaxID=1882272 RepID=UPI0025489030|nr:uncharacterized protein N7471_002330 [Penicillium samsonianum]KAJ6142877.1 hypothetical protein N7471_002330 [Penicillium samsonianum]